MWLHCFRAAAVCRVGIENESSSPAYHSLYRRWIMVAMAVSKKQDTKPSSAAETTVKKPSHGNKAHKQMRVDEEILEKAVAALLKHHKTTSKEKHDKEQLLGSDTSIQVQFGLEVAPTRPSRKPVRIDIPHPIFDIDGTNDQLDEPEVCLIVKDESKPWVQEMIAKFPKEMGFVKKVLGLESLRKKHAQYAQRRELLKKYSVFMADDRIIPMLTAALGKDFFKAKKHPYPISLGRKTALPLTIFKALNSTFLHLSEGTCVSVRAGFTHMSPAQLKANILSICEHGVLKIPRKWANIRTIAIKTPVSTSLPFYNKTPEELAVIARLAGVAQVWKSKNATTSSADGDADMKEKTEDKDASSKKRKELSFKSPLLQALKKQKNDEKEGDKVEEGEKSAEKQKKRKSNVAKEDIVEASAKKADKEKTKEAKEDEKTPKKQKKRKSDVDEGKDDKAKVVESGKKDKSEKTIKKAGELAVKETKAEDEKKKKSDTHHKKLDQLDDVPEKEKSKKKKRKSEEGASEKEESPKKKKSISEKVSTGNEDFISSKKFSGSKKGYVFRSGLKGVGYYIDVKPVPDRAALAALARMGKQEKSKNERRKSSGSASHKQKKGGKGRRSY